MGLIKKDGDFIQGVFICPAYAKILTLTALSSGEMGNKDLLQVTFGISSTRENLDNNLVLTREYLTCPYDRSKDELFEQAYDSAKEGMFIGWEDDIVIEEEIEENSTKEEVEVKDE